MIEHVAADGEDGENDVLEESAARDVCQDAPNVDELEGRLHDLQSAMDQIQVGDLDAAERAIEALEDRIGSARD
ncbi:MAG: hypothetical protein ACI81L_003361 [Verrucomicrobiales bacterium]|jgi:hypothetical protein